MKYGSLISYIAHTRVGYNRDIAPHSCRSVGNYSLMLWVSRSDMAAYREEMKRKMSEYKMNTISLVTQLYNTKEELTRVSIETQ